MKKNLAILVIIVIVLLWNFVFTDKKVGLTDQARVLQGLSSAIAYKLAVRKYWQEKGALPGADDWEKEKSQVTVDLSQSIVESIQVGADGPGVISVYYAGSQNMESPADVQGKKINLIPTAGGENLQWTCLGSLPVQLLPKRCSPLP